MTTQEDPDTVIANLRRELGRARYEARHWQLVIDGFKAELDNTKAALRDARRERRQLRARLDAMAQIARSDTADQAECRRCDHRWWYFGERPGSCPACNEPHSRGDE